jgi:Protein of unknown function (DUF2844)
MKILINLLCLAVCAPLTAYASLGGDASSIAADQNKLKGTTTNSLERKSAAVAGNQQGAQADVSGAAKSPFSVDEFTTAGGVVVREYSAGGQVFGIAWKGPHMPDLHQLLGNDNYEMAKKTEAARQQGTARNIGRRGNSHIETSGLVIHSSRRPGLLGGQAYLSAKLPQGVSASDIQ